MYDDEAVDPKLSDSLCRKFKTLAPTNLHAWKEKWAPTEYVHEKKSNQSITVLYIYIYI